MQKEIPPDDRRRICFGAESRRTDFLKVGSKWDVHTVKGCDFLLPIDAPDGWFDHQELAGTSVPLELDTTHSNKRHPLEERLRQRFKDRPGLRSGSAARGGADIRWPDAELATGKGTYRSAVGRTVLQAKIKIAVGTIDPFLND